MPNITIPLPVPGDSDWSDWGQAVQVHTHNVADLADATTFTRAMLQQPDALSIRAYIGSLQLGASATTAAAGNHTHVASAISDFTSAVRNVMPSIRNVSAATTLALTDDYIRVGSLSQVTLTVPASSTVAFPVGFSCSARRTNTGGVTLSAASGVTLNGTLSGVPQYGSYSLIKVGTDEWDVEGGQ